MKNISRIVRKVIWSALMVAAVPYQLYLVIVLKTFSYNEWAVLQALSLIGTVYAAVVVWGKDE